MSKLIEVKNLKKYYPLKKEYFWQKTSYLKAVDDISIDVYQGETLGIVGESGSGKSTLGKCITNIETVTDGDVFYKGKNITRENRDNLGWFRDRIQAIFQDPYSSLNPKLNVFDIIAEPLKIGNKYNDKEIKEIVYDVINKVGLDKNSLLKKPRDFSGGQRQRISIARAISTKPEFILCDEPISALDVSIQAQIINLLEDLQNELGLTYLFIAHDLSMVKHISHRIGVMYKGNIVEIGDSDLIYNQPLHPYTQGLLDSILEPIPRKDRSEPLASIKSEINSEESQEKACVFYSRCKYASEKCSLEKPKLKEYGDGRKIACFNTDSINKKRTDT